MSGNLNWPVSIIVGFPSDIWLIGRGPFLVDLDEDGGDEAFEGGLVGEDPDLLGAALDLLLDGSLHGVRGPQALLVALGQGEDGEALGDCRFEPIGALGGGLAIALHRARQLGLCGLDVAGIPDAAQLLADGLADGEVYSVRRSRANYNRLRCR